MIYKKSKHFLLAHHLKLKLDYKPSYKIYRNLGYILNGNESNPNFWQLVTESAINGTYYSATYATINN